MAVLFTHDGKELDVDDVPMSVYAEIERDAGLPWHVVTRTPMALSQAGPMLAQACAKILDVELPDEITPRVLVTLFEVRDNEVNRPGEFSDGMPDPKAEGSDPATT